MKKSTIYNIMAIITFALAILALSLGFTDKGQFLLLIGFIIDVKGDICEIKEKTIGRRYNAREIAPIQSATKPCHK